MKAALAAGIVVLLAVVAAAAAAPPGPLGGVAGAPSTSPPAAPAPGTRSPRVHLVSTTPLTLRVFRQTPGRRVRVVVAVQGHVFRRLVVVRPDGTATVRLADVLLRRCQPVYVRVGGLPGARAGGVPESLRIVRLPSLDCQPTT